MESSKRSNAEESDSSSDNEGLVNRGDVREGIDTFGGGAEEPSRLIPESLSCDLNLPKEPAGAPLHGRAPSLPKQTDDTTKGLYYGSEAETDSKGHKGTPPTGSTESPISPLLTGEGVAGRDKYADVSKGRFKSTGGEDQVLISSPAQTTATIAPSVGSCIRDSSLLLSSPESTATRSASEHTPSPPMSRQHPKKGIPHIYRDFLLVPDTGDTIRKKTGGVTQPFPEKLHTMLDHEDDISVVSWLPHGRAFIVRKPLKFTHEIMPKYFRQSKLTSFQRQLNLYGFRRITQGADAGAYYHELFLRGRPQLCIRMQRQKVKGTGHKQPADVQTEPNFYAMPASQGHSTPVHSPEHSTLRELQPTPAAKHLSVSVPTAAISPFDVMTNTSSTDEQRHRSLEGFSPGLRGLHGAAKLLHGISAGVSAPSLDTPFSLGETASPAMSSNLVLLKDPPSNALGGIPSFQGSQGSNTEGSATASRSFTTFSAFVPQQITLSLLARVTNIDDYESSTPQPSTSNTESSAFFWPPVRKSEKSASEALSAEMNAQGLTDTSSKPLSATAEAEAGTSPEEGEAE